VLAPRGREVLRDGDLLALAGSKECIDAARSILNSPSDASGADPLADRH
jgi:Trk K+ transport system NAD-binding subunit